jgi:hypothetical protein
MFSLPPPRHISTLPNSGFRCNPLNVRFAPNSDHCADIPDGSFVDAPMYSNQVPWAPF